MRGWARCSAGFPALWVGGLLGVWLTGVLPGRGADHADALYFGSPIREQRVPAGAVSVVFGFGFTNNAPDPVIIESIRTTCGCAVVEGPQFPWLVQPFEAGEFSVVLDVQGKRGTVTKSVILETSIGRKSLTVRAVPGEARGRADGDDARRENLEIARGDRFAVFRGECAACHAAPAGDKQGAALYDAVCAICHNSPRRAPMVPDLARLTFRPEDRERWRRWIAAGRDGSLMPGFARAHGGILSESQIDSLVDDLLRGGRSGADRGRDAASRAEEPAGRGLSVPLPPLQPGLGLPGTR